MRRLLASSGALLLVLSGCATADRGGARLLAEAGVGATTALALEVRATADRVARTTTTQNFNYAYSITRHCTSITTTAAGDPNCDVFLIAAQRANADVPQRLDRLSEIAGLRARAIEKLTAAYQMLGAEAEYDARGDVEGALNSATASATALGAALGLGPIPEIASVGVRLIGGQLAENAQQRRLLRGSARLQAITRYLRDALERERGLFVELNTVAGDIEAEARRNLAESGLLSPVPTLREIMSSAGIAAPADQALQTAANQNARLRAGAQVAALASTRNEEAVLSASISLLDALIAEHAKFQEGRPVSLAQVTLWVERLTELATAARAAFAEGS